MCLAIKVISKFGVHQMLAGHCYLHHAAYDQLCVHVCTSCSNPAPSLSTCQSVGDPSVQQTPETRAFYQPIPKPEFRTDGPPTAHHPHPVHRPWCGDLLWPPPSTPTPSHPPHFGATAWSLRTCYERTSLQVNTMLSHLPGFPTSFFQQTSFSCMCCTGKISPHLRYYFSAILN